MYACITGSLLHNAFFFYISRRFLVPKIIKELVYAIICGSKGYFFPPLGPVVRSPFSLNGG